MKTLITLLAALALLVSQAKADSIVLTLTANASSNIFSAGKIIDNITVTATTTNTTTLKFYDASGTATNYIQAAYSRYASYQTNYSTIFTNEGGLLITNTFRGTWTYPTSVTAVTNSLPAITTIVVPASAQRSKATAIQTVRGLVVVPNQDAIVEVDYRNNP